MIKNVHTDCCMNEKEMQIKVDQSGLWKLKANEVVRKITMEVNEQVDAVLNLDLSGKELDIEISIVLHPFSTLHIVYSNHSEKLCTKEIVKVYEGAKIEAGYLELQGNERSVQATYELLEEEASAHMITTTLAKNKNEFHMTAHHVHPNTSSMMENYGICDVNGNYMVEASGTIDKGAKGSKSHQSTRVLTLANKENVKVIPLLLIDENDVEASHACSVGEMNEDHLYYLQTRGLSKSQALGLLTLSYVMPILKIVESEETVKEEISEEIQRKVGL